ncbi:LuxR C-terminal-related transcriptional regulator [Desertivirga brevis]|uniref:LuxR C-terminal-related transcriptional regulator n=1 Tax=Desertivirga brevis TaxID=2810310 RepID=UPI001A9622D2|nr:LuxR C-terminal-related transcriptional regulator [Pedobacter sp. SYSU D00873]
MLNLEGRLYPMHLPSHSPVLSPDDLSIIAGVKQLTSGDIVQAREYLKQAGNKSTYTAVFNWKTMRYEEISSSVKNALGYDTFIFLKQGLEFILGVIHPDDIASFRRIHIQIFDLFYQTPCEFRCDLKFSYNFRVKAADGSYRHILRQSTFIQLSIDGKPWLEFIESVDITSYSRFSDIKLTVTNGRNGKSKFEFVEFNYRQVNYNISKRELEVLELAGKGFTTKDISSILSLSIDTVKTHRKNIMLKTGACNMPEAIRLVYGH